MEPTEKPPATGPGPDPKSFRDLAQNITGWTSNFLATAIVIVIALVCGTQLVSYWRPDTEFKAANSSALADAWPQLEACSLQFGDSPFQLERAQFLGDEAEVFAYLEQRCRDTLKQSPSPIGEMGQQEQRMIQRSANWTPIDAQPGQWRIFRSQPVESDSTIQAELFASQLPVVLGIRDDCIRPSDTPQSDHSSRLVVWGLAIAGQEKAWTTFVGHSTHQSQHDWFPDFARRTMAVTDKNGNSLTGFSCNDHIQAIRYYENLASDNAWKVTGSQQTNGIWKARFRPENESSIAGIQVQLHLNHNGLTRGIVLVQSK